MAKCTQCGQCCVYAILTVPALKPENAPGGFDKWLQFHGCSTAWLDEFQGIPGGLVVRFPFACRYLDFNNETCTAYCTIFDKPERPDMCKEYYCPKAQENK